MVCHKAKKWLLQGDIDDMVKNLIGSTCSQREIDLIECETAVDHVHVLLRAADRQALSRAMNFIKGTTSRRLFEQVPELKLDIAMNSFWQHRYGWKVVPDAAVGPVAHYIRTQKERLEKYAH
jgi:putative transposase